MGSPPQMRRQPAPEPAADAPDAESDSPLVPQAKRPPLSKRLPGMSDAQLVSVQSAAQRISQEEGHPKQAAARTALPLIEAEIGKRTEEPSDPSAKQDNR